MQKPIFQLLEFDTELFGFNVAKIIPEQLAFDELNQILQELRDMQIHLAYWQAKNNAVISNQAAKKLGGFLGSEQVTYLLDFETLDKNIFNDNASENKIEEYTATKPTLELEQLALQVGDNSHFASDPKFPKNLMLKLYHRWLENSLNKSLAQKTLVMRNTAEKIIGFITLGEKNDRADIGLLSVNPDFRGKQIGTKLLRAAQKDFIEQGYQQSQIITRLASTAACRLYEKCGYHIEKIMNYYHFWL